MRLSVCWRSRSRGAGRDSAFAGGVGVEVLAETQCVLAVSESRIRDTCAVLFFLHQVHVNGTWSGGHEVCCPNWLSLVRSDPFSGCVLRWVTWATGQRVGATVLPDLPDLRLSVGVRRFSRDAGAPSFLCQVHACGTLVLERSDPFSVVARWRTSTIVPRFGKTVLPDMPDMRLSGVVRFFWRDTCDPSLLCSRDINSVLCCCGWWQTSAAIW